MQISDLKNHIALTLVKDDDRVMAAGPLSKQPANVPYRVVIVNCGSKFSVHNQYFSSYGDITDLAFDCTTRFTSYLENGEYFEAQDFVKCIERFAERCKTNAESYTNTERLV